MKHLLRVLIIYVMKYESIENTFLHIRKRCLEVQILSFNVSTSHVTVHSEKSQILLEFVLKYIH